MTQVSSILRVDRVRETCTVSSPGTYSLTGATLGYGTFSANVPNGSIIEYGVTQTAGASWENGEGIYHSGTNTVTVTTVTSSSNAGSPITWTGQSITIFVSLNAASVTELQNISLVYSIILG
jgi:hypothetical protein